MDGKAGLLGSLFILVVCGANLLLLGFAVIYMIVNVLKLIASAI